jgi:hypothetical protein
VKRKNRAAVALARKRWVGVSKADRSAITAVAGALGGLKAWADLSAEERSAEMRRRRRKGLRTRRVAKGSPAATGGRDGTE